MGQLLAYACPAIDVVRGLIAIKAHCTLYARTFVFFEIAFN